MQSLSAALGEAISSFFMNQNRDPFGALPLTFIVEGSADPQSPGYWLLPPEIGDVRIPSDSIMFRIHASSFRKEQLRIVWQLLEIKALSPMRI